jgi:hypothetical protein
MKYPQVRVLPHGFFFFEFEHLENCGKRWRLESEVAKSPQQKRERHKALFRDVAQPHHELSRASRRCRHRPGHRHGPGVHAFCKYHGRRSGAHPRRRTLRPARRWPPHTLPHNVSHATTARFHCCAMKVRRKAARLCIAWPAPPVLGAVHVRVVPRPATVTVSPKLCPSLHTPNIHMHSKHTSLQQPQK